MIKKNVPIDVLSASFFSIFVGTYGKIGELLLTTPRLITKKSINKFWFSESKIKYSSNLLISYKKYIKFKSYFNF